MRNAILMAVTLLVSFALAGCASPDSVATEQGAITVEAGHGRSVRGPIVLAEIPEGTAIRSVAGDTSVLFTVLPASVAGRPAGVYAFERQSGRSLGAVTAPPGGWLVPLSVELTHSVLGDDGTSGELLFLDASTPPPGGMLPAHVYRYTYRYDGDHGLTSTLQASAELPLNTVPPGAGPPNGVVYPASVTLLPDGIVAVSDSGGAIWVSADASLGGWHPGFASPLDGFGVGPAISGFESDGQGGVQSYTLQTPSMPGMNLPPMWGLYPGIEPLAYIARTDEIAYAVVHAATPGMPFETGIFAISRANLLAPGDPTAKPHRLLVSGEQGGDLVDGLAVDRSNPSAPWLYFQRAPCEDPASSSCNALRRVNVQTGEIQDLYAGIGLINWSAEIRVLQPDDADSPCRTIAFSNALEPHNGAVNVLLGGVSTFPAPSLVPALVVCEPRP